MSSRSRAKAREAKYAGPVVDGVQYAPGYTQEAAEYEERTKMIRINIDDKPRPSWIADDMEELLYEQLMERLLRLGATGMGAGWEYYDQPDSLGTTRRVRGQVTARFGDAGSVTITAPTPMEAVKLATRTLSISED